MPLALDADEGRSKLRKATGRSKHPLIRGYPNGGTLQGKLCSQYIWRQPGEVKHLSNRRKRNRKRYPK